MSTDPRKPDPRFPDRPQHEDYYLMSEAIQELDARADSGESMVEIVSVDPASLLYMAKGRRQLLEGRLHLKVDGSADLLYIDGFTLGMLYAEKRAQQGEV